MDKKPKPDDSDELFPGLFDPPIEQTQEEIDYTGPTQEEIDAIIRSTQEAMDYMNGRGPKPEGYIDMFSDTEEFLLEDLQNQEIHPIIILSDDSGDSND